MVTATVTFATNPANVSNNGEDVFAGVFNGAIDGMFDNNIPNGNNIVPTTLFGGGAVNSQVTPDGIVVVRPTAGSNIFFFKSSCSSPTPDSSATFGVPGDTGAFDD